MLKVSLILKKDHLLLISISSFFAVYFRLKDIGRDIVSQDEGTSLVYFILPPLKSYSFYLYFMPNNHIFHSILANLSVQLFGNNEIGFRSPVLISGILAVIFMYWWAFLIFNSKKIAFISSLFLAFSPIHIAYSQTARGYSLIILFAIISLIALFKILENYRLKWMIVFVLSNVLSVITIPSNLFFVASQFLSLAIVYIVHQIKAKKDHNIIKFEVNKSLIHKIFYSSIFIFTLIAIFYFPILSELRKQASIEGNHLFKDVLPIFIKNHLLLGLPQIMAIFFLYGSWILYCKRRFWGAFLFLLFLLPFFVSFGIGIGGFPRNYLFALPFFILTLSAGLYETSNKIVKIILTKDKDSVYTERLAAILTILVFSIPTFYFLEKNYYPQYNSYKYKELRDYTNKLEHINNLIFKGNNLRLDYYIGNVIERNASGIMLSNNINDIYLITQIKNNVSAPSLQHYISNLDKKSYRLLKEIKDPYIDEEFDFILGDKPNGFRIEKIVPSNVRKLIERDFFEAEWVQVKGSKKTTVKGKPNLKLLEFNIHNKKVKPLKEDTFIYANSSYHMKVNRKGFIFITYALTYPNISKGWISEPVTISLNIKNEKNKTLTEQPKLAMNRNVSGFDFRFGRLWYIMQKIVPIEKGDYNIIFGFWIKALNKDTNESNIYTVKNLQAYLLEF